MSSSRDNPFDDDHLLEVAAAVDEQLRHYFDGKKPSYQRHVSHTHMWENLEQVVIAGGKRLRPYLLVLAYETGGRTFDDSVIQVASGWEMLHQCMLIHDDIIDRDILRHGQPNISGRYRVNYELHDLSDEDRAHFADSAALIAGDLALSAAYELILESPFDPPKKLAACQVLSDAIHAVALGELHDTEASFSAIDSQETVLIAEMKTASYSFIGPLMCGALLADMDEAGLASIAAFGRALGIAYQLKDDWLGLFGETTTIGKSNTSDITEGKRTSFVEYALLHVSPQESRRLQSILGNPDASAKDFATFRSLIESSGARAHVEGLIKEYTTEAKARLRSYGHPGPAVDRLLLLSDNLIERRF